MGWFSSDKKKWQSLPADEVANALMAMKPEEAKKAMQEIKKGKVPGLTVKQQKQIEKDYKRAAEGERGVKALFAGFKGGGSKNYGNLPARDRMHPSEYRRQVKAGKIQVSAEEAMQMKKTDPQLYQSLLETERRRRGL